ncbi:hypothetical protein PFICI_10772 [Pestalotiopsis fici W106-1]|uniref:SnoaL-like domain-containing protein n=1 Tax=Pestalotiopsis fici (strain W106-1 / CGMCC3.15140) TaxID=1229662 RepID=W3WSQ4_PESFW|nr:uncharacterized protein PFICI_10772 [Pestalotiopsis fici W106-1]ETS76898.1 hypothetical protein PFICI_10772 [Pestalotiopsis fici W106-1]
MERLVAQNEIYNTLVLLTKAEDDLDKELLLSFLEPDSEITFDISGHLDNVASSQVTPIQYWTQTVELLSGFTATQHHIGNPIIDVSESLHKARISVEVIAYHCIQDGQDTRSVTARARQIVHMDRSNGKWFVKCMRIDRKIPLDNPELYEVARD